MIISSNYTATNFDPAQYQQLSDLCKQKARSALRQALDLPVEYESGNNILDEIINNIVHAAVLEITSKVHAAETANEFVIPVSQYSIQKGV